MCYPLSMMQEKNWEAWKNFIFTAAHILAGAETQLQNSHGIGLSDFDVLVALYEAPDHTLKMSTLKEIVLVTTSGLSRAVTRASTRGWITKEHSPTDKRQVTLTLTEAGLAAFREIAPPHRAHVRDVFFDALSPKDQADLGRALGHLRDHIALS